MLQVLIHSLHISFLRIVSSLTLSYDIYFPDFDYGFKPPVWDKDYVHIWDDRHIVRLYNKYNVLNNPELYIDKAIANGDAPIKMVNNTMYKIKEPDIVFLSYDENAATENYNKIKERFPRIIRSHGVKGILNAHKAAAKIATTSVFYVVDADAEIDPLFDFSYYPSRHDMKTVHVWRSRNPINDLIYGYGGVKLFPRQLLIDYAGSPIDFTTSVSTNFKVMPEVSNVTKFNTDPFSAWRSGFRECTKLAAKLITNHNNTETEERLAVWCAEGSNREFGEFAIKGANDGAAYGKAHKNQPELIGLINDYDWLKQRFNSQQ